MIDQLIRVAAVIALFVFYGWLQWNRPHRGCGACSCGGGICERTGEPRHLDFTESSDVRR
jgi:hypothetical protein